MPTDEERAVPEADIADVIEQQTEADRDDGEDEYPHLDPASDIPDAPPDDDPIRHRA